MLRIGTQNFRDYLEREFQTRLRKNPSYSLRAFARYLGIPPSKLSEIRRGLCGLSGESALRLAGKLRLSDQETELFVQLVESEHSRGKAAKLRARARLAEFEANHGFSEISLERFRIISDWHHFAILELTDVESFNSDPLWISHRLGISLEETGKAIERLLDFGLLRRNAAGRLEQTHVNLATPSGIPSREIKEHHSQILNRAEESLFEAPMEERDFSAVTMAIDPAKLDDARKYLKDFRRKFCSEIQSGGSKTRVFCLAIQFFPMDQMDQNNIGDKK